MLRTATASRGSAKRVHGLRRAQTEGVHDPKGVHDPLSWSRNVFLRAKTART